MQSLKLPTCEIPEIPTATATTFEEQSTIKKKKRERRTVKRPKKNQKGNPAQNQT